MGSYTLTKAEPADGIYKVPFLGLMPEFGLRVYMKMNHLGQNPPSVFLLSGKGESRSVVAYDKELSLRGVYARQMVTESRRIVPDKNYFLSLLVSVAPTEKEARSECEARVKEFLLIQLEQKADGLLRKIAEFELLKKMLIPEHIMQSLGVPELRFV